ncbi:MAG: hypothetical protein LBL09_01475 [Oscillospiraceae bacterium]|jgi:hypothetical protein|nr:hypothetical protein [Oscillospiraceae bacterium]
MNTTFINKNAVFQICVNGFINGAISGEIYHRRLSEPVKFTDINDFLYLTEALMDKQKYPQAFQNKRTFKRGQLPAPDYRLLEDKDGVEIEGFAGRLMTFTMYVVSRQNVSWQGYVRFAGEAGETVFHSELDLIRLILKHVLTALGAP